ncbi:phosphatase PAP2 family protein [Sinomicrobium sp. M5D2P9]
MNKRLNSLLLNNPELDACVNNNFNNLRLNSLFLPLFLLLLIALFLFKEDAFSVEAYAHIQKDLFFYLNSKLSQFSSLQYNLNQLGNVLIFLPFLTLFMVKAPKFWQSLITALIVSSIFSNLFKKILAVPRPAAMFDRDSFVIIGRTLSGSNSLPSGHSITTFTILVSVFFAFMPKKMEFKIAWFLFIFSTGLIIAFTRVGVGAHYPLDVIVGSILGYLAALTGIFITKKFNPWTWITNKKYYPISIVLFSALAIALINKIVAINLMIFYFSLVSLVATLIIITCIYVKK